VNKRRYYGVLVRIEGSYRWLLWYTNEIDGLHVDNGRFPAFDSAESLAEYAAARGIVVNAGEAAVHDIDRVVEWLLRPAAPTIDSAQFLTVWNLLQDAARSAGSDLADRDDVANSAYEKLFRAGGPQWSSQSEDAGSQEWSPEEVQRIAQVLKLGLDLLRDRIASRA
jgi:hypothetical protein